MPYQVTFVQYKDACETETTGIVTREVKVGDEASLVGQDGWWTVVAVSKIPWMPIQKWNVGGVTSRRE